VRRAIPPAGTGRRVIAQASRRPASARQRHQPRMAHLLTAALSGWRVITNDAFRTINRRWLLSAMPGRARARLARAALRSTGLPGAVAIRTGTTLTAQAHLNESGQALLTTITLSLTKGTPPAVVSNKHRLMVHHSGRWQWIARPPEGDVAPGTSAGRSMSVSGDGGFRAQHESVRSAADKRSRHRPARRRRGRPRTIARSTSAARAV
jgi:hypothetical protein